MTEKSFRTIYKPFRFNFDISYQSKMMFVGSCFTENIGRRLEQNKFVVTVNPFGIVYNPVSVVQSLNFILENREFSDADLFYHNEYWHSFFHHGRFSDTDKQIALDLMNSSVKKSYDFIKKTDFLFITFGTTWVYKFIRTGQTVANCHKVPANEFTKECLSENEIVRGFNEFVNKIRTFNNKVKIIFSLSPVRHLKDGFVENSLSKAILRTSIEKIKNANTDIFYFPAYEILNDDLRDYRFYDKDLVHPNETATDYIFDYFENAFFTSETKRILNDVKKIISAKNHRIFNSGTEQSKKFIQYTLSEINRLTESYPFLCFDEEKDFFKNTK